MMNCKKGIIMKSVNNKCSKVFFLLLCTFVSTCGVNAERSTDRLSEPAYLPVEGRAVPQVALSDTRQNPPEVPFFQAILLLESPISPSHTLIREAIQPEYEQGIKHYLSLGAGELLVSAVILIDLDDYYGVSPEGKTERGEWVTLYVKGGFHLHVSLLPVTVGYLTREAVAFEVTNPSAPNAADPYFDVEYFWGARAVPIGYEFQAFNVVGHEGPTIDTSHWKLEYTLEAAKAWYTLGPIEVKKQLVEAWFKDMLGGTGSIRGVELVVCNA